MTARRRTTYFHRRGRKLICAAAAAAAANGAAVGGAAATIVPHDTVYIRTEAQALLFETFPSVLGRCADRASEGQPRGVERRGSQVFPPVHRHHRWNSLHRGGRLHRQEQLRAKVCPYRVLSLVDLNERAGAAICARDTHARY